SKISRDLFCFPAANLSFSERSNHAEPILNNHLKMFKNTFQSGFLSILYSLGSKPLQIWDKEISDGHVKRPHDEDIQSDVLEIIGSKIQSAYITCPADPGIKLSFLVILVKNLKKYFTFEIQVLDDKNVRRRFRASNFQVCKFTPCFVFVFFLVPKDVPLTSLGTFLLLLLGLCSPSLLLATVHRFLSSLRRELEVD
ncbi:Cilia- and flagella-associated protein 20, partial [Linum perenne]